MRAPGLLLVGGLVAGVVTAGPALTASPAAAQSGGTTVCGEVQGSPVWTTAGSPYRICAGGVSVQVGLTIDASAGPVEVIAQGAGGLHVDGSLRTVGTAANRAVTMRPAAGNPWAGLDVDDWSSQVTDIDHLTVIGAGARFVDTFQPMTLDAVSVQGSPGVGLTAVATEVVVRDARVNGAGGAGMVVTSNGIGLDENGLAGDGTTVERAVIAGSAGPGLVLDGLTGRVADNVFVDNGRTTGQPAARIGGIVRSTVGLATNQGAGNGVHALAFDGATVRGGLSWRSPGPAAGGALAPLGYVVATALKVRDGDLTLTPGTVLKMGPNPVPSDHLPAEGQPAVIVSKGTFVADGAVITSLTDDSVGVPTCASALAGDCTPAAADAGGVTATSFAVTRSVFQYGRVALARDSWPSTYPGLFGMCQEPCPIGPSSVTDSIFVRSGTAIDTGGYYGATAAVQVSGNVIEDAFLGIRAAVSGPAVVAANVLTRAATGIVVVGDTGFGGESPGPATFVHGNEVRQSGVGIVADRPFEARVVGNVVRDSGLAMRINSPYLPPINLSVGGQFDGNLGTGNAVDGILLNAIVAGDWTWQSIVDQNGAPGPLGYAATQLIVEGTMTVPQGGTVRVQQLTIGGTVDARAGDATFTDLDGFAGLAGYASPLANPIITVGASTAGPRPSAFLASDVHFNGEGELRSIAGNDNTIVLDGAEGGVSSGGGGPVRWSIDASGTVRLIDARFDGKVVAVRQTGAVPAEVTNVVVTNARMRLTGAVTADRVRVAGAGSGPTSPFSALTIINGPVTVTCSAVDGNLEGVDHQRGSLTIRNSDLGPMNGISVVVDDDATADLRENWWGQAGGPTAGQVTNDSGTGPPVGVVDTSAPLGAPSSCAPSATDPGPGPVDPGPAGPGPVDPGPVDPGPVGPGPGRTTNRLQGPDRVATAIAVSSAVNADDSVGAVILVRSDGYADALAGTPLAAKLDAPVLLTPSATLDVRVAAEIHRVLSPGGVVYVLGGPAAIADQVDDQLRANGFQPVRFAGENRFETAVLIAVFGLGAPRDIVLATGTNFPDSLAAGVAAAYQGSALLLTDGARLPEATAQYLASPGRAPAVIAVGGPAAAAYPQAGATVVGTDRYATAVQLAELVFGASVPFVGLASGENFPDALAGGALMGRFGGPLLLSPSQSTPPVVAGYIQSRGVQHVTLFGGPGALAEPALG